MVRLAGVLLVLLAGGAAKGSPRLMNDVETERLTAAVLKDKPRSMAITYTLISKDRSKSRSDLEAMYRTAFDELHGSSRTPDEAKAAQRERFVEMNVESAWRERDVGRKTRVRLWYRSDWLRIDHTVLGRSDAASEEGARTEADAGGIKGGAEATSPVSETTTIETVDHDGRWMRRTYYHGSRKVTSLPINERSTCWTRNTDRFVEMPAAAILRTVLCDRTERGDFVPDKHIVEQLRSVTLRDVRATIDDGDPNASVDTARIEIALCSSDGRPWLCMTMVCDKEDYSKLYSYEGRTGDGKVVAKETRGDFDEQGFPHRVSVVRYDSEGKLHREESYRVEKASVNGRIDDKEFEVESARQYTVMEREERR